MKLSSAKVHRNTNSIMTCTLPRRTRSA